MTYAITTGRLRARPPMLRDGADVVEVLDTGDQRRRVPVAMLQPGMILLGLGVVARVDPVEAAAA